MGVQQYERLSVTAYNKKITAQFSSRAGDELVRDVSTTQSRIEMSTTDSMPWAPNGDHNQYLTVNDTLHTLTVETAVSTRRSSKKGDQMALYSSLDILNDGGRDSLVPSENEDSSDDEHSNVEQEPVHI